ncbi:hypothetical protein D0Z08_07025 [Nocardioides immobilis]|uniref:Heavy-metal-associated domain-containing protein n=1 Tax=Nocardioides immobilis TaxID=2049295 RepID=A0A417Y678_9ACTN|nr:hypothetical protein [Nocardioides immobilis]RHW28026.1 hypothetical protein D0Z08_07025 [Nocardioides immobilis]
MSTTTAGRLSWAVVSVLALALTAACEAEEPPADPDRIVLNPPAEGAGHAHAPGEADPAPVGDGTRATAGGYRLAEVRLPRRADGPGAMTFRILGPDGRPVTDFTEQQTKQMHLYVVRTDYAVYRHLHPTLAKDGTWTAPVDLDDPGGYRVIADFLPSGAERPVVLGAVATVPGSWRAAPLPTSDAGDDGLIQVRVDGTGAVGDNGRLHLVVTTVDGEPVTLGTYLGTSAHVSGFRTGGRTARDRVFVHVHPYGEPEPTDDGTRLTFHTTFERAGDYRLVVQVRVEGLLHTVPVTATVEPAA